MNLIVAASAWEINYKFFKISINPEPLGFAGDGSQGGELAEPPSGGISPGCRKIDSLLSLFLLYLAQIIVTELILGVIGALYLVNVILLNLGIFLFLHFGLPKKKPYTFAATKPRPLAWLRSLLPGANPKQRPSAALGMSWGMDFNYQRIKEATLSLFQNRLILLSLAVILGFGITKIFINLVNPPFGWDSLNYHFVFPLEWLKDANLNTPITISDDPSPSYYPINGSLFYLWLIFPFKNVFLADLGQLPFFILAVLSVFNIARRIGINRAYSFYAAVLFLLIPNFFKQLSIAYVDLMVAGLFLACLNFLIALSKEFSWQNTLLYAICQGLFLGTKTVALPYSVLLFPPFIYICLKNNKNINKLLLIAASMSIVIILGGFSYIRNFVETGNPLYPLDFQLMGKTIFKGVMDSGTYQAHFTVQDYRLSKLLFHEGLGPQSLLFILPSVFLALPVTLIKRRKQLDFSLIYLLTLPISLYLIYRFIIPLANTRYLYPLLGIGMIVGFYTAQTLNMPHRIVGAVAAMCILASMAELAKRQELIAGLILTFTLFLLLPYFAKYLNFKSLLKVPCLILSFILLISALLFLEKWYLKNEYPRYLKMIKYSGFWPDAARSWDWLNNNTHGQNIAYVGRPVPFPLYGSRFKNNVYYVSVNKTEPAKLHYFPASYYRWDGDFLNLHRNLEAPGNYRFGADYSLWLNNLKKRAIDYLFIYSLHQIKGIEFPLEDLWAADNPGIFKLVFKNETIHIYRLMR